ncbi:hypothetical protein KPG71_17315 [Roseovarius sp. PS-C2]|uniref:hypothetical protein n=1 Tax=Roseovarius sp. PS-C2 TaxID=2820814 RepID=UPI001C0C7804|nr:hypothetical protein [Roseovarius sp. PS-C2]MBU3261788.1 hypothetical protein [Roseovarius sp. PS-C2]
MLNRLISEVRSDAPAIKRNVFETVQSFWRWTCAIRGDLLLVAVIAVFLGGATFILAHQMPEHATHPTFDTGAWFESDLARVKKTMTARGPHNYRTYVHPLQTLLMYVPTKAMIIAGLSEITAVMLYLATIAGLWGGLLYATLRGLGLRRPDAIVFTALGASTSASVFWFPVPESYGVGALSLMITFALGVAIFRYKLPAFIHAVASASSLSIATTNWMAGILLAFSANSYKRAIRITLDALLIVTVLFAVQKVIDPNSQFFVPGSHEWSFVLHESAGGPLNKVIVFFLYGVAMPAIPNLENAASPDWAGLTIQTVMPSQLAPAAIAGLLAWMTLLVIGVKFACRTGVSRGLFHVLSLYIAFELFLHLVYGDETFLFSLNYVPAMVLVAGCSALSSRRVTVLALALICTGLLAYNNLTMYVSATAELATHIANLSDKP